MSKDKQHLYEGMYILSTTLSEDARKKALDRILNGIESKQGKVLKIFDQGRRKLAHEIEEKREGYYYILFFSLPPHLMKEIWEEYHLNEDLLRFLTLRVEEVPESIETKSLIEA